MVLEFKLPDIGEGIAEGEIVQWLVNPGDEVAEFQAIVEVMTDKATVEIPSPAPGKIGEILAAAGDVVPVGSVIFTLETGAGGGAAAPAPAAAAVAAAPAPAQVSAAPAAAAPVAAAPVLDDGKSLAVPSARRVARELGVALSQVQGTGRNGVIRRSDVEAFHASGAASAPNTSATGFAGAVNANGETRVPFRGVRRKIADAMVRSAQTAVHFTVVEEIDVTDLVELRATAKQIGLQQEIKVTYMPFIMKAVANGLMKFPMLNGHLDVDAGEIVNPHYVNLGIATDTPSGLIVPVIKDVQNKGVLQLAQELQELAQRTREGKVTADDLKGSTFTISNAGNIGGTIATPIINFPDIAILGVHRLMKKPGVVETPEGDKIEVRQFMNYSCSVDHRLADGADAARFLAWMRVLLEKPGLLSL